jgi:hypothetical protein
MLVGRQSESVAATTPQPQRLLERSMARIQRDYEAESSNLGFTEGPGPQVPCA